ncbi:AraC family transcriptional regulator ligand-binding domain-containing protein [Pseudomonadota bacterium]
MATIACHYVKAALVGSIRHGYDANDLLVKSGINPRLFASPTGRVSDSQMTRLVQRIWWVMADEFMGFTRSPCKQGRAWNQSAAAAICGKCSIWVAGSTTW